MNTQIANGRLTADIAIARKVEAIARTVPGVADVSRISDRATYAPNETVYGIVVSGNSDKRLHLEVHLIALYDANIKWLNLLKLAEKVKQKINLVLMRESGISVKKVDVFFDLIVSGSVDR